MKKLLLPFIALSFFISANAQDQVLLKYIPSDVASVSGLNSGQINGKIDLEITRYSLEALNIDQHGLDEMDNKILTTIIDKFNGGPVGISTISTAVGEDSGTIEEVYEPFLIKEGFIKRTPRGREVTERAYKHLGKINYGGGQAPTLF